MTKGFDTIDLFGVSIHSAPIGVLEKLALSPDEAESLCDNLRQRDEVGSALVVSTCNRTEVYVDWLSRTGSERILREAFVQEVGPDRIPEERFLYREHGLDGVRHLYRVACGLDSVVLGEAQILGQLKSAWDTSQSAGVSDVGFERMVHGAFRVAAQSRTETEIGAGAVSVASAGVHLATRIFSDLSNSNVAVVGAGETGRLVAEHFARHQPRQLVIINRTLARAEELATKLGGRAAPLTSIEREVADADIVAFTARASEPLLSVEMVERAREVSHRSVLALLDLGLPRNVDPAVNEQLNVFVHDIEALKRVVSSNLSRRRREVPRVEAMIEEEIERLSQWRQVLRVGPLIAALKKAVEEARLREVSKASSGLSEAEVEAVERATRAVTNKLLHGPVTAIKHYAQQADEGADALALVRSVFGHLLTDEDDE